VNLVDRSPSSQFPLTPSSSFEVDTRAPLEEVVSDSDLETTDTSVPATPSPLFRAGTGGMGSRARVVSEEGNDNDLNISVEPPSKDVDVEGITAQLSTIGLGLMHEDTDSRFIKVFFFLAISRIHSSHTDITA
jgi:hypothetical protein